MFDSEHGQRLYWWLFRGRRETTEIVRHNKPYTFSYAVQLIISKLVRRYWTQAVDRTSLNRDTLSHIRAKVYICVRYYKCHKWDASLVGVSAHIRRCVWELPRLSDACLTAFRVHRKLLGATDSAFLENERCTTGKLPLTAVSSSVPHIAHTSSSVRHYTPAIVTERWTTKKRFGYERQFNTLEDTNRPKLYAPKHKKQTTFDSQATLLCLHLLATKLRLKCIILTVVLHGCASWSKFQLNGRSLRRTLAWFHHECII